MKNEIMKYIDEKILGFGYSLTSFTDHLAILSWIQYIAHKCNVGRTITNFDEREFIQLPSGKYVRITVQIEDITEEIKKKEVLNVPK